MYQLETITSDNILPTVWVTGWIVWVPHFGVQFNQPATCVGHHNPDVEPTDQSTTPINDNAIREPFSLRSGFIAGAWCHTGWPGKHCGNYRNWNWKILSVFLVWKLANQQKHGSGFPTSVKSLIWAWTDRSSRLVGTIISFQIFRGNYLDSEMFCF